MPTPYVRILEQNSRSSRFRYVSEGRPGNLSRTQDLRTTFCIEVGGYVGVVVVIISCVEKDPPYRAHPYKLVGRNCKKGVCTIEIVIGQEGYKVVPIEGVAVQCVPQKEAKAELAIREKIIDPFQTGFRHAEDLKSFLKGSNWVRLCFQVFDRNDSKIKSVPVVSEPILNTKNIRDPLIHRISHCNSPVSGKEDDIILLCTKIDRNDIAIRFFQILDDEVTWENYATFRRNDIYNASSICFRPPVYHNQEILEPVKVQLQLVRPSDQTASPSIPFEYLPLEKNLTRQNRIARNEGQDLFAQFVQNLPYEAPPLPETVNEINRGEAPISPDLLTGPPLLEDPTQLYPILSTFDLQQIQISSGDFDMGELQNLSETLQENLVV